MQKEGISYSFYILAGFVFLFMIFLAIKPSETPTGLITIPYLDTLSSSDSKLPVMIIGITLILALGLSFVSYKHFKKKKQASVQPPQNTHPTSTLSSNQPSTTLLSNDELKALFPEPGEQIPQPKTPEIKEPIIQQQSQPQQKITNLNEIKDIISNLISQGNTKQQILSQLQSKGYSAQQITKATEEINQDKLISYIKSTLSQGFKKEQIEKTLLESGWEKDQVSKAFQILGM